MRLLIIGASGLVGSHLRMEALSRGYEVRGTYRSCSEPGLVELDLADTDGTRGLLEGFRPDWVIHAAGWTWVDGCERDPARCTRENCEQPVELARLSRGVGARFTYLSSSYVFDGAEGPYAETHVANPINAYGRAKRAAEEAILRELPTTSLVLRTICVWGVENRRKNFAYQALAAALAGRDMLVPNDQCGNPTWAGDVAAWATSLMAGNQHGIWNLAGDHPGWTREQWVTAILDGASRAGACVPHGFRCVGSPTAKLGQPAARPLLAGLDNRKIRTFDPREPRGAGEVGDLVAHLRAGS